jgi:hypothetical protein
MLVLLYQQITEAKEQELASLRDANAQLMAASAAKDVSML